MSEVVTLEGPYGEAELELLPGRTVVVAARGLFAILELRLDKWDPADAAGYLFIERGTEQKHLTELMLRLGQLGARPMWPTALFFTDPTLSIRTGWARGRVVLRLHHEAVAP